MTDIAPLAPSGSAVVEYDRDKLATYAEILDRWDAGSDWQEVASVVLGLDPTIGGAEDCWRSHLERARWIIGDGLGPALAAFGRRSLKTNTDAG